MKPGTHKAQVYWTVAAAGDAGLSRAPLLQLLRSAPTASVDNALFTLVELGLLQRTGGQRSPYRVVPGADPGYLKGRLLFKLEQALLDFAGGASAAALADELGYSVAEVEMGLAALACPPVHRIELPRQHGGGTGYVHARNLPQCAAAPVATPIPFLPASQPAHCRAVQPTVNPAQERP